jgi:acetyl-CoA acetyltransferase family protein
MARIRDAVLVDFVRTPFGRGSMEKGFFRDIRSDDLGIIAVQALLKRTGVEPAMVEDIIIGSACQIGEQAAAGRDISLAGGFPFEVPGITVDRACTSSMAAAQIAVMAIRLGEADIVIAGGIESSSHFPAPVVTPETDIMTLSKTDYSARWQPNPKIFDRVDPLAMLGQGITAEYLADMFHISREEMDQWALRSNLRAAAAQSEGRFKHEIVPVEGKQADGSPILVDFDQDVRPDSTIEKIRSLPPVYKKDGKVNAASSSKFSDGGAAAMFMSKERARELGLKPMVTVRSISWVGCDPKIMGYGATLACKKALEKAGLTVDDIDLWETNEAFAVVPLVMIKELGIDPEKVNVNGGACCIGHPVGASGIRMVGTLAHEMNRRGSRYGVASICGGFGQGTAMVIEREKYWKGRCAFLS